MSSVNMVVIIGNSGRDPELRYTQSGAAVCSLSVATSRQWKDKASGERQEETEWHRVVLYDRLAEIAGEYVKKGRPVYVRGRLKTRKWADKDGVERYTTEIIADELQLLGGRDDRQGAGDEGVGGTRQPQRAQGPGASERAAAPAASAAQRTGATGGAPRRQPAHAGVGFDEMEDDIPFVTASVDARDAYPPLMRRMARNTGRLGLLAVE